MTDLKTRYLRVIEMGQKRTHTGPEIAEIGVEIDVDPLILDGIAQGTFLPVHHDLLIICAAIEYADRRWPRNDFWSRNLHLSIPVTELAIWQNPAVSAGLEHVLRYLTCDNWRFNFVRAHKYMHPAGQKKIIFGDKTFAIAYSDGLDSRAVWALSGPSEESVCIRVAKQYHKAKPGDSLFMQIPFAVSVSENRESTFRTRAFQFAALTAIAAHIGNFNRIVVPESGQGALSPALLPLHRVYADYRNYPTFFRKMEHFIVQLLNHKVCYEQSRLWFTKGQTMSEFLTLRGKTPEDLISTRSCWQARNVVNHMRRRRQCGLCAACVLRRFSLHEANVVEPQGAYVIEDLTVSSVKQALPVDKEKFVSSMTAYGIAAIRHFQQFADMAKQTDQKLSTATGELATALNSPKRDILQKLRILLTNHEKEWTAFISSQGRRSFLLNWLDGGA